LDLDLVRAEYDTQGTVRIDVDAGMLFWSTRVTVTINTIQSEKLGSQRDQGDRIDSSSQVASLKGRMKVTE
jgi:hypothetical protein